MAGRRRVWVAALALAVGGSPGTVQGQSGGVEVALSSHGGRLVVPVRAGDGSELSFLLSTGSNVTVLSESGARRAGGAGLSLGGLAVDMDDRRTVVDEDLTTAGRVFDGQIGSNTLNRFDMLVDLPGGRLVLRPVGRSVAWDGVSLSAPIRLRVYHGVILGLDVELNGRPYPAMLELGSSGVQVNERVMAEAAVGGAARLRLGDVTFAELPVSVSEHPVMRRFSPDGAGFVLVGAAVAVDCALSVSWVHRELRTCVR